MCVIPAYCNMYVILAYMHQFQHTCVIPAYVCHTSICVSYQFRWAIEYYDNDAKLKVCHPQSMNTISHLYHCGTLSTFSNVVRKHNRERKKPTLCHTMKVPIQHMFASFPPEGTHIFQLWSITSPTSAVSHVSHVRPWRAPNSTAHCIDISIAGPCKIWMMRAQELLIITVFNHTSLVLGT